MASLLLNKNPEQILFFDNPTAWGTYELLRGPTTRAGVKPLRGKGDGVPSQ
ncbi:MAG: hypothetical protein KAW12_28920 [Candidatus Aminicenantes bacterium]|nr:hypothetical protein [Candidatus Aminicenantes bacterium]